MSESLKTLDYKPSQPRQPSLRDDVAYYLPMLVFLIFVWIGGHWPSLYVSSYVARTCIVAVMLVLLWRRYTKIRWNYWWLGVVLGVVGIFQWIGMQLWLQAHFEFFKSSPDVFDPSKAFHSQAAFWAFIAVRLI